MSGRSPQTGSRITLVALPGSLSPSVRSQIQEALGTADAVAGCRILEPDAGFGAAEAADVAVLLTPIVSGGLAPDLPAVEGFLADGGAALAARWIVVASAAIREPSHRNPGLATEDERTRPPQNPIARAWRTLEDRVRQALPRPLTILRPPPVPAADGGDFFSRLLHSKTAAAVAGFDPPIQLLHPADLAAAISRSLELPDGGVFHLAPASVVSSSRALELAGVRRLPVPGPLHRLWRRSGEASYLRYPWTVSSAAAADRLGWTAEHSSAAAAAPDLPREALPPPDDDHGMSREYIAAKAGVTGFLHDRWWRIEQCGLEHVPRRGAAVLAGIHRGHQPYDGVMILHLIFRELGRVVRFLTHPTLVKFPFLATFMAGLGGVPSFQRNADRVLAGGHLVGIFPEGIQGAFRLYRDAYRLGSFGRHDFVKLALRHQVPIVPFVTVGSAEVFPIFAKIHWRWWRRWSEWPCLPVTPTMSLVPLPSKWHTRFLEPFHVEDLHPPEAADDPAVVRELSLEVRRRMQETMTEMRQRRKSIWRGSIFADGDTS